MDASLLMKTLAALAPRIRPCVVAIGLGAATFLPAQSQAHFQSYCRSLLDTPALVDESTLSADDRAMVAIVKQMAADDNTWSGRSDRTPPTIYNFNSLFIAINPGIVAKEQDFGSRVLILATLLNGVTFSAKHPIRSPRYHFLATVNSRITTTLSFFGDTVFRLTLSEMFRPGGGALPDQIRTEVTAAVPDEEKIVCEGPRL